MIRERDRLQEAFREANLELRPFAGQLRSGPVRRRRISSRSGVLVREGEALGYPGWSRVTVGDSGENDRVIGALA